MSNIVKKYSIYKRTITGSGGQSTVEAAILLPLFFVLLLVVCQPVILLYNLTVMDNAAAEGCRLLSTKTAQGIYAQDKYEGYVKRRLAAIPPIDIFHAHTGAQAWDIGLVGDENATQVTVRITNKLKPLPLLGWGTQLLGMCDSEGYLTQEVERTQPTQPVWVWGNSEGGPAEWVQQGE